MGLQLFSFLETQTKIDRVREMLIRTAFRYRDTAWGFYQKQGYKLVGYIDSDITVFRKLL